jgi:uncharacterized damage-inducible protein DinB
MDTETIHALYRYHDWVNHRLLDTAERLPVELTHERFGASFDSIHNTLAHILAAQIAWLSRWKGITPDRLLSGSDFPSIQTIRERWRSAEKEIWDFIEGLTSEKLAEPIRYANFSGQVFQLPLWQMMLHVVNHATHHRSELADMLTRAGHAPPATDLHVFFLEQSGQN